MYRSTWQNLSDQGVPGYRVIFRSSFHSKAILILLCCFFIKVLFSCREPEPLDMQYSKMELELFDNSGHPFYRTPSDTLYSDAVAIQMTLSDSGMYYYAAHTLKAAGLFSFAPVYGFSPNISYQPVHLVRDIHIFTLFDLDDRYRAGDDITDSILYAYDYGFGMYKMKEDAIKFANGLQSEPSCLLKLFLKSSVHNTSIRLRVEVILDDGSILSGTTDEYPVIPSYL